jgi:hypothetical protein
MRFQIVSGTTIQELVEWCETAAETLNRVRALKRLNAPNIRVLDGDGRKYSLTEIEELAEDESASDLK